jgi:multidrug efflux pump subunit AcrA (membrane-fusion protein)
LLVEVHVPNPDRALLPGMYARVDLMSTKSDGMIRIPSDALIARGQGTEVAVVVPDHRVHLQKIEVGRDYGDRLEVISGLHVGDMIIPNPSDVVRDGMEVQPVQATQPGSQQAR